MVECVLNVEYLVVLGGCKVGKLFVVFLVVVVDYVVCCYVCGCWFVKSSVDRCGVVFWVYVMFLNESLGCVIWMCVLVIVV